MKCTYANLLTYSYTNVLLLLPRYVLQPSSMTYTYINLFIYKYLVTSSVAYSFTIWYNLTCTCLNVYLPISHNVLIIQANTYKYFNTQPYAVQSGFHLGGMWRHCSPLPESCPPFEIRLAFSRGNLM